MNLETLGFEREDIRKYQAIVAPIEIAGERLGTLFFYKTDAQTEFTKLGETHKLFFKLDHFVGCRFGLFLFSTKETGGVAEFSKFRYF